MVKLSQDREKYSELTALQQNIIDAIARNPDADDHAISNIADCCYTYPYAVRKAYPDIIEQRKEEIRRDKPQPTIADGGGTVHNEHNTEHNIEERRQRPRNGIRKNELEELRDKLYTYVEAFATDEEKPGIEVAIRATQNRIDELENGDY